MATLYIPDDLPERSFIEREIAKAVNRHQKRSAPHTYQRRQKSPATSSQKTQTRRDAYEGSKDTVEEAKHWVMGVLHVANGPMCPQEIEALARSMGYSKNKQVAISVACTLLEQQGHVVSTDERGEGFGGRLSVRITLAAEHQLNGPDPKKYMVEVKPAPYPSKLKWSLKKANIAFEDITAEVLALADQMRRRLAAALQAIEDRHRD